MKRNLIIMATLLLASVVFAEDRGKISQLRFSEIPYTEGKLFVSVTFGETTVLAKALEIQEDSLSLDAELSAFYGKELLVRAFQDLNGNNTLDLDEYGRPTEPCLQTIITPNAERPVIDFQLMQY